jgi:cytochrome c peroxidase
MRLVVVITWSALALAQRPEIPAGLDAYLPVPESNPLTREGVDLGKRLFFDTRLSRDKSLSCATCHDPEVAFTDRRAVAVGIGGKAGSRRVPRLINRAYGRSFFWDGRAVTLEDQMLQPIENPKEMDLPLSEVPGRTGLSVETVQKALASYVRTILSGASRFDRFLLGDAAALTAQEQFGLQLFRGKAGCTACHVGPNLTDERFHNTGIGWGKDKGRAAVTGGDQDLGAFKTPGLREVARTPPYMHDGSLKTLEEVIDFYDKGGEKNPALDSDMAELKLTADEKTALSAFLRALNGTVRAGL